MWHVHLHSIKQALRAALEGEVDKDEVLEAMLLRVLDVLEVQVVVVNTMELRAVQEQQTKDLQAVLLLRDQLLVKCGMTVQQQN